MFGIGSKEKKAAPVGKYGAGKKKTDSTGFTEEQKKAQKTGSKKGSKAISKINDRRKAMQDILGN